jgi:hypothetical protein
MLILGNILARGLSHKAEKLEEMMNKTIVDIIKQYSLRILST